MIIQHLIVITNSFVYFTDQPDKKKIQIQFICQITVIDI